MYPLFLRSAKAHRYFSLRSFGPFLFLLFPLIVSLLFAEGVLAHAAPGSSHTTASRTSLLGQQATWLQRLGTTQLLTGRSAPSRTLVALMVNETWLPEVIVHGKPIASYELAVSNGSAARPLVAGDIIVVNNSIPAGLRDVQARSTGSAWIMKMGAGHLLTATYRGAYPILAGTQLPLITVRGIVAHTTLAHHQFIPAFVRLLQTGKPSPKKSGFQLAPGGSPVKKAVTPAINSVYQIGQTLVYTLAITNNSAAGSVQAGNAITVNDVIPAGLTGLIAHSTSTDWKVSLSGTISPATLTATYVGAYPVAAGAALSPITLTGTLTTNALPQVVNTANVSVPNDSNPNDNTSTSTVDVTVAPDLAITKTVALLSIVPPATTATQVYGQNGDFTANAVNTGGISATSLNTPAAVAVDNGGNLYTADFGNNRVLYYPAGSTTATRVYGQGGSFTSNTANTGGISATSLNVPAAVTVDNGGNLYISDFSNNRVLYYPAGSTTATRVYGQGGSFTSNTANTGGISAASLNTPNGVALDSSGNLYIADALNNRVLYYPAGSTTATRVYGQGGSFTANAFNTGGISATSLNTPTAVAVDNGGNLYVSDFNNNRVLYYPAGSTTATRVYGQGGSFTSNTANTGGISATSLNAPLAVTVDNGGNLYVCDFSNNRVLYYPAGSTTATQVYGQGGSFTSNTANTGGISATSFNAPFGDPAIDSNGNLYVADNGNNRILMFPAS